MTIDWRRFWWQPGCTAAFFAIGAPYWQILPGGMVVRISRGRRGEGE